MIDHTLHPEPPDADDLELAPRVKGLPPYLFGKINEHRYPMSRDGVIDLDMGNPTDALEPWVIETLREAARERGNHRDRVSDDQTLGLTSEIHRRSR
jgi:alanine-synthesizing transaminase